MELELSYWDCLALLNIESEEEARDFDGLCIQPDGITLIVESYRDVLSPGEIANLIRLYPNAERGEPVLTFPVAWPQFKRFIETWSLVGCVDAIKAVDWVLERRQAEVNQEARLVGKQSASARRLDAERNHNALVGLLVLAMGDMGGDAYLRNEKGRKVPNLSAVAKKLTLIGEDEELELSGLGSSKMAALLTAALDEIETRRQDSKITE